jgi:hypothetical protein
MTSKSGKELGEEHVCRLQAYIDSVDKLPSRGGKLNVSAVAMACQFDRGVLYNNPRCKELIASAVAQKGLVGIVARDATDPEDKAVVRLERRVHDLEQLNAALKAEVFELRRQLARSQIVEEHTIDTGRRIKL